VARDLLALRLDGAITVLPFLEALKEVELQALK
jgi:hypothetical protein